MPTDIIAEWLNLPSVKFDRAITHSNSTAIHPRRDYSPRFTGSGCAQMSFWSGDCREARIRDLSVFEFKTYLVMDKHGPNCPPWGVKMEKLELADSYSRGPTRFEELVARLGPIASLKQVAELLDRNWKTVQAIDQKYLEKQLAVPDYHGLRALAVDEIASPKGLPKDKVDLF